MLDCRDLSSKLDMCATEATSSRFAALVERYSASFPGNRIEFERVNCVCRLLADTPPELKPGSSGLRMLKGLEQDSAAVDEANPAKLGNVPGCRVKLK